MRLLGYAPAAEAYDEAVAPGGAPRPHYAALLDRLADTDLAALAATANAEAAAHGVALPLDPVPRLFTAGEWARVAAGLEQRTAALAAFAADAHGPRRAVAAGVVDAEVIETSRYFEPDLVGTPGAPAALGMAGPDLVRLPSGELVVLEDNVRTPSLKAFAAIAAQVVRGGGAAEPFTSALIDGLRAALGTGRAAVLSDGASAAEAAWLARALDLPHVTGRDLAHAGDRLVIREGRRPLDAILRHTPEERLRTDAGEPTWLADALLRPLRAGTLAVVNPFGAGVADDKRTYARAGDLVRFFTGAEPLLRSVPTLDLGRPDDRAQALDRLAELVFKPRSGSGGRGIVFGPRASAAERADLRARLRREPGEWIAQEIVAISTHPTVAGDRLVPRRVDLRAYVIAGRALPGGLTRYAASASELVVNGAQGGGGKATLVVASP